MIIGSRTLHVQTPDGSKPVEVRVYLPRQTDAGWECAFAIGWPEKTLESAAIGDDGLHALNLAQQKIAVALYMSKHHASGALSWQPQWVGYGFPMPKNGRDLLIGHDQEFYGLDT
jgi:hypothetical protein